MFIKNKVLWRFLKLFDARKSLIILEGLSKLNMNNINKQERKVIVHRETFTEFGVTFSCEQKYYQEPNGDVYVADDLIDENLLLSIDAYRKKVNLLTSYEIKAIHEGYKLSPEVFARALGLKENEISAYETKKIQSKEINTLLVKARDDSIWFLAKLRS